jgi:hypothetical protein
MPDSIKRKNFCAQDIHKNVCLYNVNLKDATFQIFILIQVGRFLATALPWHFENSCWCLVFLTLFLAGVFFAILKSWQNMSESLGCSFPAVKHAQHLSAIV